MKKIFIVITLFSFLSCKKEEVQEPDIYANIKFEQPANFPKPIYDVSSNPPTPAGFKLGKALFYDGLLSADGSVSCGTCHQQEFAFTHHEHDVSHGINDQLGIRNAPSLQNMAWQKEFNWDGTFPHLETFSLSPIQNPVEMGESIENVLLKIKNNENYKKMFTEAFGSEEITQDKMMKAITQFLVMMVSADSRYDRYKAGKESFTEAETRGLALFEQKCSACHSGVLFTDASYRDNGLAPTARQDIGREFATNNAADKYKFKVPSLRNIAFTRPYMHDGRFTSLEQVLSHYQNGVRNNPNLDNLLKKADGTFGIALTEQEKIDIIAFLQTLTDQNLLKNEIFSEFNNTIN
ncbi:MAG: cytochrome c peroxidase [Thermonemataceae bacterium]|nr:cytochrome c peroxidase [Thermonemataceae bacterium]